MKSTLDQMIRIRYTILAYASEISAVAKTSTPKKRFSDPAQSNSKKLRAIQMKMINRSRSVRKRDTVSDILRFSTGTIRRIRVINQPMGTTNATLRKNSKSITFA